MIGSKIVKLFPPKKDYVHYVEPYFGGGSVLFKANPEGVSEVANDINSDLYGFWLVLRNPTMFAEFRRLAEATPFNESTWNWAEQVINQPVGENLTSKRAWAFFVLCRQSLAGRMKSFTGVTKTRTRRGMNNEVSAWLTTVEWLPAVHERLKRVLILNRPALEVIQKHDGPKTLFYLDPPYLHKTRVTTTEYGENEMDEADHLELLVTLDDLKGKFLLSGYKSRLYDNHAKRRGWSRHEFKIANAASGAKKKRVMTEVVWANYEVNRG